MPLNQSIVVRQQAGFLEEDNGNKSSMRLMSMIALIASIVFGGITITSDLPKDTESKQAGMYITFGFLLAAFAPKALQKFAENMPRTSSISGEIVTESVSHESSSQSERLGTENAELQRQLDALNQRIDANPPFASGNTQPAEDFAVIVPDTNR
jgi:hypothetical protein